MLFWLARLLRTAGAKRLSYEKQQKGMVALRGLGMIAKGLPEIHEGRPVTQGCGFRV